MAIINSKTLNRILQRFSKTRDRVISLDYPTSADNKPRWGYGAAPHPILTEILERKRDYYKKLLTRFSEFRDYYRRISLKESAAEPAEPYLLNAWLPGLDSLALYCMLAIRRPATYMEIGSGNSTRFARRSIRDHHLQTELISIDPKPRAEIDELCTKVIRESVETVSMDYFDRLKPNDILFVDNSHRCFMNSDVTVTFLDILPRLKPGVLVHIHDIFLPYDYPPHWAQLYYSEQYLLAACLLADCQKFDIVLPNAFISHDTELQGLVNPIFSGLEGVSGGGGSFWVITKQTDS